MAPRLLITGFDPFGGASVNPAWQAVQLLPEIIADFEIHKLGIPTVFGKAAELVIEHASQLHPDVILCIGQAGGRDAITPERIAVNIRDARISDNEGNQPQGEFCIPEGDAAYFATVPVAAMAQAIRDAGIPAAVSNSAGAFVCNDTLYCLLHHFARTNVKVGFLHVPYAPEQGEPSMAVDRTAAGLIAAIHALQLDRESSREYNNSTTLEKE